MKNLAAITLFGAIIASQAAFAGETPSMEGASVYFVNVQDGDTVPAGTTIVFGLNGMGVAPAGTEVENTGHHHLLINRAPFGEAADDADSIEYGYPADDNHIHFGKGQTEIKLDLPPGTHTLQLALGDLNHVPHNPPVLGEQITITVE